MRVTIIAIDGLEYNLVEKWNINTFKQKYYGKHDVTVAVKPGEPLYTPLIWASFLLGEPSYIYGYTDKIMKKKRGEVGYSGILKYLFYIKFSILGTRQLKLREILLKLGLFKSDKIKEKAHIIESMPSHLLKKTFIQKAIDNNLKVKYNSIPSMPNDKYAEYRVFLYKYFNSSIKDRILILNKLYNETESDLNNILNNINTYDLVIYYTPLLDEAHHMLYRPNKPIAMVHLRRYYKLVEKQFLRIVNSINYNNSLVLIVSDHGYDPSTHEHSNYGFWSSNLKLEVNPSKITDFRWIIEKYLYNYN
ncbi:MAG: alkaline phosphatase family protein [Desulfurococcales archaeon]|nr:alkaline phosphatase family protein [Desulfurococcales archaeon]